MEAGLAKPEVEVSFYTSTLKIEYQETELAFYTIDEWLLFLKLPDYTARTKPQRKPEVIQLPLLDLDEKKPQQISS